MCYKLHYAVYYSDARPPRFALHPQARVGGLCKGWYRLLGSPLLHQQTERPRKGRTQMDFIQHSIAWAKGELFESTLIGLFGVLVITAGLLFWRFGQTPASKAMLIPLALAGLIFTSSGVSGYMGNQKRIAQYETMRQDTAVAFVQAEKERVEGFASLRPCNLHSRV